MSTPSRVEAARAQLDELVRSVTVPGIQYLVVGPDQIVFEYAGGSADIAGRREMSPTTTMMAYSMSKTITAAAVLQLIESERVKLDDPIDAYLDISPYGPRVTVRQLISHTSGIPNPIPLRWVHLAASRDRFDERAALTKVLREHPTLSFPPGAKYSYSNIGYWLLGCVIERGSREPFQAYVREHVLEPLGIGPPELGYVVPDFRDHAKGYLERCSAMNLFKRFLIDGDLIGGVEGRWVHLNDHYVNGAAFGGLVGTVRGFGKFLQDQLRAQSVLFGGTTHGLFYAPQRTTSGASVPMTLGWHIGAAGGVPFFYKEGGGGGFHSMMRVYESSRIATVVMTNATRFDVNQLLDTIDPGFSQPGA
ncbi:MAG TPA: serine hydrolase domain-containing protein [Gemmatimonadaceae bacterium]|nr:serine hydrolase domain-containing protein [Gemmatimonadaceae bacterium]